MFKTFNLKRIDFVLLTLIISLNVFGIFAVGSARPDLQIKQIEGMVVGLALMLVSGTVGLIKKRKARKTN